MMLNRSAIAVALLAGSAVEGKSQAETRHMQRLMRGARPTENSQLIRRLDEEDYMPDISGYSLKFEQCQFVKSYDDELAEDEESTTVLGTKRFVIFKLCPTGSNCNSNYGEYAVMMEDYLESMTQYAQEAQESMCEECEENCQNNNNRFRFLEEEGQEEEEDAEEDQDANNDQQNNYNSNYDCECMDTCYKIENMEENGYIDATNFLECQQVYEDNYGNALYAGPFCSNGEKIKIGVFTDEECMFLDTSKDVEDYLQDGDGYSMKLSHALLKTTYDKDNTISCLVEEEDDGNNDNGDNAEAEIMEVCENLYETAAKCEKTHGFDNGYSSYSGYENQLANEETVCNYISSIKAGSYSEEGEIVVGSGGVITKAGGIKPSGGQKFALTFFILGTVGLAVYAAMLHSQLTRGSKAALSKQGGAMA